jgi:hypothetical protein
MDNETVIKLTWSWVKRRVYVTLASGQIIRVTEKKGKERR